MKNCRILAVLQLRHVTGTTVNTYTYDHCSNRTSHTLTMGGTTVSSETYTYDTRSRMASMNGMQGTTTYSYYLDNSRSMEFTTPTAGKAFATMYSYGATGILSAMATLDPNSPTTCYSEHTYTYYMDGNVYTETDTVANTTTTYTYDLAGRLKTEVSPAGTYSYTYDAAGNRASMTENGTTTTYTYDKNNRLLTETKAGSVKTYTYDANGNMLTGDGATYTYDARDRQSGVVKGTASASYTYYPTGLRKTKLAGGANTTFVWDGENMVLEYTNSAASGKVYVYGFTLISQGNSLYYIYNAHGDVVKYMNSSGTVLRSYEYDAFGEEVDPSTSDTNPFRYAGQYYDTESGTYYLRARYYNPALGRFTQQDAWGYGNPSDPLSLNLYVYCYGNPVRYYDPSGRVGILGLMGLGLLMFILSSCDSDRTYSYNINDPDEVRKFASGYHDTIDKALMDAIHSVQNHIETYKDYHVNDELIEYGIFICKTKDGLYYATSAYRGNEQKVQVRTDIAKDDEILIFIHSHPHDRNENILWNSDEINDMIPGVLNMIIAPKDDSGSYTYYYHPYNGNADNNFIEWEEDQTYYEIWGQYYD